MESQAPAVKITLALFYIGIIAAIITIFVVIGTQAGNRDNSAKVASALNASYIAGGVIVGVLLLIHLMTYKTNTELIKTLMIYTTFIMAYMAMCISLINVINT